ncbi:MAG TPA: tetratricopeptide repeat protein [Polyangia bacterium]|nr:tetratricopeptide repeat protein [Polyangia bacterium]
MRFCAYHCGRSRGCAILVGLTVGALVATLAAPAARAEDRDSATVGKITLLNRKAVDAYQHLEFETAVRLLNEALDVSEHAGLMLHPIRARTYVTMGIVTLGGFKQRDQAIKYFRKALQIQPEVRLSAGLANPEIQAAFDEAIASLASGTSDELPPEKALVHEPVRVGQMGRAVPITVVPDKDLGAAAIVLRYRPVTAPAFIDLPMQKDPSGTYVAAIPASATKDQQAVYFIEARRSDGSVLVRRGSAVDPMVVALVAPAGPTAGVETKHAEPAHAAAPKSFYFALLAGSGVGTASGTGEETRSPVTSSGIAWTQAGQLAPEIGYFITPQLRVGVQARLQYVSGATPFHLITYDQGECGSDHTCAPFTGAFAGLAKAAWSFLDPEGAFQPYATLSAGYGTIRHLAKVSSPPTCGGNASTMYAGACTDTVAGGPILVGPGVGLQYRFADSIGFVAEIGGLVGFPNTTVNVDLNIGLAFEL